MIYIALCCKIIINLRFSFCIARFFALLPHTFFLYFFLSLFSILFDLNEVEVLWMQVLWFMLLLKPVHLKSDEHLYCAVHYFSTDCTPYTNIRAVCMCSCKLLKAKQKLKKWQLLPPGWANAPTDWGEGSYPPVLQRGGKALKLLPFAS